MGEAEKYFPGPNTLYFLSNNPPPPFRMDLEVTQFHSGLDFGIVYQGLVAIEAFGSPVFWNTFQPIKSKDVEKLSWLGWAGPGFESKTTHSSSNTLSTPSSTLIAWT